MFTSQSKVDALRSLGFASIAATYNPVGSASLYQTRIICFTNTTDADVVFSTDTSTDRLIVAAGGFKLFDITTNHRPENQDDFCFAIGTQWYVRYLAVPTKGSVYIENVYAQPQS